MSTIPKILLLILGVQCLETSGNPLFQGLSFQRGFEINFKPWPLKPIAFIQEKWSPFGVFGKKFAIQKRSIDDMGPGPLVRVPRPAAPVFEHIEEIEHIGTGPLFIIPKAPVASAPIESPKPPPKPEVSSPVPLPVPLPIIVNELPPLPDKSVVPPISTNMIIIQPTKVVNSHVSTRGLYTDISRVESVKEHLDAVKPVPPPHVPEAAKPSEPVPPVPPPPAIPIPKPPVPPVPPPPVVVVPPPPAVSVPPPPVAAQPPPEPPKAPEPIPPETVSKKEEKKEVPPPYIPHEVPKSEIFTKDSSFVKGSKMALQFGTVFLTLMAQFFDNARATIDQMTNPPPKFNT